MQRFAEVNAKVIRLMANRIDELVNTGVINIDNLDFPTIRYRHMDAFIKDVKDKKGIIIARSEIKGVWDLEMLSHFEEVKPMNDDVPIVISPMTILNGLKRAVDDGDRI